MTGQPIKKPHARHAGITTLPSFVLPEDEALNMDMARAATPSLKSKLSSFEYTTPPSPLIQSLNAMPARKLADVYSYGRRDYSSPEAAKVANPDMPMISNVGDGRDPGDHAARLAKAMEYSKNAHDLFGALGEAGGGKAAKEAFAPLGRVLDTVGAGATFAASRQRGEPLDVAVARTASPVIGSIVGEPVGNVIGAIGGGFVGSGLPVIGTAIGGAGGAIAGGLAGSYAGGKVGERSAEEYARMRRYGW